MNHFSFLRNTCNSMVLTCLILVLLQVGLFASESPSAQQADTAIEHDLDDSPSPPQITAKDKKLLNQKLQRFLTEITFRGHFTTDKKGSEKEPPKQDEYTITSATHVGGDYWLLTSRIQYKNIDVTLPVPVIIRWASTTPLIMLEEVTLPGMGTFSARVLIHRNRYAGTWQHDDVGGHLFGSLSKSEAFSNIPKQ